MMMPAIDPELLRYAIIAAGSGLALLGSYLTYRASAASIVLRVAGYLIIALSFPALLIYGVRQLWDISYIMIFISSVISLFVSIYTTYYSRKYGTGSLQLLIDAFALSIIMVFASRYLLEFVLFWLIAEAIGFFVITYDALVGKDPKAWRAGLRYLAISMIPADVGLMTLLALAGIDRALYVPMGQLELSIGGPIIVALVALGFMAKAALAPLHFWLADAHSIAPAPGSALLSGLMVKMGIYALIVLPYMSTYLSPDYWMILIAFGSLTVIYGGLQALVQSDIKRILAYSTISHTSEMAILIALYLISGNQLFYAAVIAYMLAHALYKSGLFMDSGFIEFHLHTRDISKLGFISRLAPKETLASLMAVLSLIGIPPTMGFLAKLITLLALAGTLTYGMIYIAALAIILGGIVLALGYGIRYLLAHLGSPETPSTQEKIEIEGRMVSPIMALSVLGLIIPLAVVPIAISRVAMPTLYAILLITLMLFLVMIFSLQEIIGKGRKETPWLGGGRP